MTCIEVKQGTWRNEVTSYNRYGMTRFFCDLFVWKGRERALEARFVSFSIVRHQEPTTGILLNASKQKRKRTAVCSLFPTVSSLSLDLMKTGQFWSKRRLFKNENCAGAEEEETVT